LVISLEDINVLEVLDRLAKEILKIISRLANLLQCSHIQTVIQTPAGKVEFGAAFLLIQLAYLHIGVERICQGEVVGQRILERYPAEVYGLSGLGLT
jgi:hypothetical protein